MKIIIASLLFLLMTAAVADQVYRWVDKDGHVHYSQTPPAATAVHAQSLDVTAPPPDAVGVQNAQNLVQQMQARNQQTENAKQQAQEQAQRQAQQQQRCNELRAQLQILQQVGTVATVDAQGNRTYWSDAQHSQKEQQLQQEINKECSSATN